MLEEAQYITPLDMLRMKWKTFWLFESQLKEIRTTDILQQSQIEL